MNVLMVTWNAGGNVPPFLGLGHELGGRGHRARCLAPAPLRTAFERHGIAFEPTVRARGIDQLKALPPDEAETALQSTFFDDGYVTDVREAIGREPTDILVIDCFLVSAQIAAEAAGVPYALLVHMPLGWLLREWDEEMLPPTNVARVRAGLAPLAAAREQWRSARRLLVATTPLLDKVPEHMAASLDARHVGPIFEPADREEARGAGGATGTRKNGAPVEIATTDESDPLVLVSFSTTAMDQEPALRRVIDALASLPVRALVTTGPAVAASSLPSAPNVRVEPWLPHAAVLPRTALLITHGGHGTVSKSFAFGVPMLVLPLGRDQHFNAARVEELGAGLALAADASPAAIAAGVRTLLGDPRYGNAARRAAALIAAGGPGAVNAANELEAVLGPLTGR